MDDHERLRGSSVKSEFVRSMLLSEYCFRDYIGEGRRMSGDFKWLLNVI